ncbi:MAG: hypothetical protein JNL21_26145 [Myxococcales bacterium]|nr:hypothetical protein [Myxococcales bacterium]
MLEDEKPASTHDAAPIHDATAAEDDTLVCARCGAAITRERDRVERFGTHVHDRVNPAGFPFRIGCFARADGARGVGAESDEFPWFPRHRWLVVVCAGCSTHVGWRFSNGETPPFWGLVLDGLKAR